MKLPSRTNVGYGYPTPTAGDRGAAQQGVVDCLQAAGFQTGSSPAITANTTLAAANAGVVLVDASAGSITLTLMASGAAADNVEYVFVRVDTNGANTVTIQRSGSDTVEGATSITLPVGERLTLRMPNGATNWRRTGVTLLPAFMRNEHRGFILSTAGASTTMTIGQGQCADTGNVVLIDLASSINKTTGSWAVGSGNGGLDTGTIAANTWYYFHAIRRPDTGVVDVLISLSPSAPTMPTNYTQRRLLMAWRTNASSQWASWRQTEDEVDYQQFFEVFNGSLTSTRTTRTATLPNAVVMAHLTGEFTDTSVANNAAIFTDPAGADVAPVYFSGPGHIKMASSGRFGGRIAPVRTSGGQIADRSVGAMSCTYGVVGFDFAPAKGRNG